VTDYTVLGAGGFIGSHLARVLEAGGRTVSTPARGEPLVGRDLGAVFYCIGLTSDFRTRPYDTVEAHVGLLSHVLEHCDFTSLVYLSSTRIYRRLAGHVTEDEPMPMVAEDPDDLYGISKILGESLGFSSSRPFKVARLSNVYGADRGSRNFLGSLIEDAIGTGRIVLETALDSRRDYLAVDEAARILIRIAEDGVRTTYNVASGSLVTTRDIADRLRDLTGCTIQVAAGAATTHPPAIDVTRIKHEFGFVPRGVLEDLPSVVGAYRRSAGVGS
jgi:nucleoside-diphosphate-sugar epimerase